MPFRAPFACLLGGLFAMLVGVSAYQYTHVPAARQMPLPDLSDSPDPYSEAVRRHQELSRFDGVLLARAEQRRQIIEKLCDGEVSLFDAAADFKRMNSLPNPCTFNPLLQFPGDSDNERLCIQVMHWLEMELNNRPPSQRRLVLSRVELELCDHLARNGKVVLPGE